MTLIDIDGLLAEISADAPCGDDLEYDPAYGELERATQGKPEQQFGGTIVPAEEPDWARVEREASALLVRTKDLRVASQLARALARTQGWTGFRDGLILIRGFLERYWDSLHPRLDPDDDNDPTVRINTIVTLCDQEATLEGLRSAPLVSAQGIGTFSLRDLQIATKELPAPKDPKTPHAEHQLIAAAFHEADLDQLRATLDAIGRSAELVRAIESLLGERVGVDATPDFSPLTGLIQAAYKAVSTPLAERTGVPLNAVDPTAGEQAGDADMPATSGKTLANTNLGAINNRADVMRAIDLLLDYYQRQEPSSPLPLLLKRARGLVSKDFLEILQDLAPDGLAQARAIRGPESDA